MTAFRDTYSELKHVKKWQLAAMIVISLAEQLLLLAPSILVGRIVDRISSSNLSGTGYLLLLVLGLGILHALLWPIRERFVAGVIQNMVLSRSQSLTTKLFGFSYELFAASKVGAVTKIVERAIEGFENLLFMLLTRALPAFLSIFLVLAYFSFQVPLALPLILVGAAAYIVVSTIVLRWRRDFLDEVNDAEDNVAELFALTFLAAPAIKVTGYVSSALRPLSNEYRNYALAAKKLAFASGVLKSTQIFIMLLTTVLAIGSGLWMLQGEINALTAGDFVVVFSFVGSFMTNLASVWQIRETLDEYDADSRTLHELYAYDVVERLGIQETPQTGDTKIEILQGSTQSVPRLNIANAVLFNPGDRISITGKSGSGKSVLLEHIVGIKRSSGTIHLNGQDLDEYSEKQIARQVAYSGQKTNFLSGDHDYSIFFRKLSAKERKRVKQLAEALQLEVLFSGGPDDFSPDTLSGGERRRLGLLRAILEQKPILVLDEPTSELDSKLAKRTWDIIKKETARSILLVATHDEAIIEDCNLTLTVSDLTVRHD